MAVVLLCFAKQLSCQPGRPVTYCVDSVDMYISSNRRVMVHVVTLPALLIDTVKTPQPVADCCAYRIDSQRLDRILQAQDLVLCLISRELAAVTQSI